MRRTRHVVLPVRSWRYIGLLIVSLACLTLGLVSRDREGHAGSLIGPELEHRAPHEEEFTSRTDACPNLNSFTRLQARSIIHCQSERVTKPANDHEIKVSRMMPLSRTSVSSQSLNHDRLSKIGSPSIRQESFRIDSRRIERSWSRRFDTDSLDKPRKSQSRRISQFRDTGNSYNSAHFTRSRDSIVRNSNSFERRSLDSVERRRIDYRNNQIGNPAVVFIERREIDKITPRVSNRRDDSMIRRNSPDYQQRTNNYRVDRRSMERRVTNRNNRQVSRDDIPVVTRILEYRDDRVNRRSEVLERRIRSTERHKSDKSIRHSSDREEAIAKSYLNRVAEQTRRNIDRNNNLDNRSQENRRIFVTRIANRPDNSRLSIKDTSRDSVRSNDRRLLSRSRTEYLDRIDDLPARERLSRRSVNSMESDIEDSDNHRSSYERRGSLVRSSIVRRRKMEQTAERRDESRLRDQRLIDRTSNRENIYQSRGRVSTSKRDWHRDLTIEENRFRITQTRQSRYQLDGILSMPEREERFTSSSLQRNPTVRLRFARNSDSIENHEISRSRNYLHGQDLNIDRRERTYSQRYRDERRTVPRDIERRRVDIREKIFEKRAVPDSARLDSRRSLERRINGNAKFSERPVIENRRLGRNSVLRDSFSIRITGEKRNSREFILRNKDRRSSEVGSAERRDIQTRNSLKERRVTRSIENRFTEYPEVESIRLRQKSSSWNFNDPSRSISSVRRIARISHAFEQNSRKQQHSFIERKLSRASNSDEAIAKWGRNTLRISKSVGAKIIPASIRNNGSLKYSPMNYDIARQAVVIALCMIYGLSAYNGKNSLVSSNIVQRVHRLLV